MVALFDWLQEEEEREVEEVEDLLEYYLQRAATTQVGCEWLYGTPVWNRALVALLVQACLASKIRAAAIMQGGSSLVCLDFVCCMAILQPG